MTEIASDVSDVSEVNYTNSTRARAAEKLLQNAIDTSLTSLKSARPSSDRFFIAIRVVSATTRRPMRWCVRDGDDPRQRIAAGPFRTQAGARATANFLNAGADRTDGPQA